MPVRRFTSATEPSVATAQPGVREARPAARLHVCNAVLFIRNKPLADRLDTWGASAPGAQGERNDKGETFTSSVRGSGSARSTVASRRSQQAAGGVGPGARSWMRRLARRPDGRRPRADPGSVGRYHWSRHHQLDRAGCGRWRGQVFDRCRGQPRHRGPGRNHRWLGRERGCRCRRQRRAPTRGTVRQ
jgi:hypothetical protein